MTYKENNNNNNNNYNNNNINKRSIKLIFFNVKIVFINLASMILL